MVITRSEKFECKGGEWKEQPLDASNVAVWLTPLDRVDGDTVKNAAGEKTPQLVQRHKTFEPHVLIVPVGTRVEFPNKDPFFHNIFSLFDGKRFDLGLYEAGTTRTVLFDRAGVSFLFCNIHAEMSAVVLSVDTPYFGLTDRSGNFTYSGCAEWAVSDECVVRASCAGIPEEIEQGCDDYGSKQEFRDDSDSGESKFHAGAQE